MPFMTRDALYTKEEIAHCDRSKALQKFVERKRTASPGSGKTYGSRLAHFAAYVYDRQDKAELDDFITTMTKGEQNPYDVLAGFCIYLQEQPKERKLSVNHIRTLTISAKKFLRFSGVPVDNETFREQVLLPRKEHSEKAGIDKATIIKILNACRDMRLKTVLMFYAASGVRAVEGTAMRWRDLDLKSDLPTFSVRKEYSKMRVARTRPLTEEMRDQLRLWREYKFRKRWTTVKGVRKYAVPEFNPDSLVFSKEAGDGDPEYLYDTIQTEFGLLLDSIGLGEREEGGKRRTVTLNRFRSWVKTMYSDLGHGDYGEWFIGHAGSTYYRKSEQERVQLFRQLSGYITFLDAKQLQASAADIQAKLDAMQKEYEAKMEELRASTQQQITALQAALMAKEALHQYLAPAIQQK